MKICKSEYLDKAALLSQEEQERLLSRMAGKLPKRLQKEKLTVQEAIAIQLEIEDEQLQEWRQRMQQIKKQSQNKPIKQTLKTEQQSTTVAATKLKATSTKVTKSKAGKTKTAEAKSGEVKTKKTKAKPAKASAQSPSATPAGLPAKTADIN